ncbi:YolD-like family protein [Bacillus sp. ISL-40]|nr:YolD-like family protein [Bacillus sp. ISL-40]
MFKDQERIARPILDEYEAEEFDKRICYAMEFNLAVKITVWDRWL